MSRTQRTVILIASLLVMSLACRLVPATARAFENESISFTFPDGWKTTQDVWDRPASLEEDFKGLGVQELVTIQYPPRQGKGNAFFVLASSPLEAGQDLESRFAQAYEGLVPEIEDVSKGSFEQGGLSGYEITYLRPWGEPWWKFRDIWLEKNSVIYVLSFHASPNSFDDYTETVDQIIESFQFKD